jgi:hypothetical protein
MILSIGDFNWRTAFCVCHASIQSLTVGLNPGQNDGAVTTNYRLLEAASFAESGSLLTWFRAVPDVERSQRAGFRDRFLS